MNPWIVVPALTFGVSLGLFSCARGSQGDAAVVLRHTMKSIDGGEVNLGDYLGNVVVIVNVASKCGFTPQYAELEKLYQQYRNRGLVVLGFPANDFLRQEPGTNEEIAVFCSLNYGVTFPMFEKITVTGRNKDPLYEDLTSRKTNPAHGGGIKWNFTKFLVGRDGRVADRFSPTTGPLSPKVIEAVEKALGTEG